MTYWELTEDEKELLRMYRKAPTLAKNQSYVILAMASKEAGEAPQGSRRSSTRRPLPLGFKVVNK